MTFGGNGPPFTIYTQHHITDQ